MRTFSINYLFAAAWVGALLLGGCSKADAPGTDDGTPVPVSLSASVQANTPAANAASALPNTRTAIGADGQTAWKQGDAVSVFMLTAGGELYDDVVPGALNKEFTVSPADGALTPADGTPLYYPQSGNVDFVAVYPYWPGWGTTVPNINPFVVGVGTLVDQTTAEKQVGFDYMHSNNATDIPRSKAAVELRFRHVLSRLKLDITLGTGLAGGTVTGVGLNNMPHTAFIDIRDGSIDKSKTLPPATISSLRQPAPSPGADATYTALVPPQAAGGKGRTITVTVDGTDYTGIIPDADAYDANTMYTYPVTVKAAGVTVGAPGITPWTTNDNGSGEAVLMNKTINGIETMRVFAGTFQMGSSDGSNIGDKDGSGLNTTPAEPDRYNEETQHKVTLTKDFYMSKYPITNAQYAAFLNDAGIGSDGRWAGGSYSVQELIKASRGSADWGLHWENGTWVPASGYENHPVIYVTWYGAASYCEWLSQTAGCTCTLPSEAQWEYACRGGQTESLPFGIGEGRKLTNGMANFDTYSAYDLDANPPGAYNDAGTGNVKKTTEVGTYPYPNGYGLYDMYGNVWEWCLDKWDVDNNYLTLPATDPVGTTGSYCVLRGGSWSTFAKYCRSAYRSYSKPEYSNNYSGFRVVFVP